MRCVDDMHLDPQSTGAKVHWFASACSLAAFCVGWAADSGKIPHLARCLLNAGSRGAHLQLQPLLRLSLAHKAALVDRVHRGRILWLRW